VEDHFVRVEYTQLQGDYFMEMFAFRRLAKLVQPAALIAAAFAFFGTTITSQAGEPEPGKDMPWLGRYEGSVMEQYRSPLFDEAILVKGSLNGDWKLQLEGNVSFYHYVMPENRSALEVYRNYESSLKAKGVDIVFSCATIKDTCGGDIADAVRNETTRWPWGGFGGGRGLRW